MVRHTWIKFSKREGKLNAAAAAPLPCALPMGFMIQIAFA